MNIQIPIKRDALEFVGTLDALSNSYRKEYIRLVQPQFGVQDDDEVLKNKVRADCLAEFIGHLERIVYAMEKPLYTESKNL